MKQVRFEESAKSKDLASLRKSPTKLLKLRLHQLDADYDFKLLGYSMDVPDPIVQVSFGG